MPMLMDRGAFVHVVYSGLDKTDGTFRLKAGADNNQANARNLTSQAVTMADVSSSFAFNIKNSGYHYLYAHYDNGTNTTGSVSVYLTRKQVS
jgi:hypothetical protein